MRSASSHQPPRHHHAATHLHAAARIALHPRRHPPKSQAASATTGPASARCCRASLTRPSQTPARAKAPAPLGRIAARHQLQLHSKQIAAPGHPSSSILLLLQPSTANRRKSRRPAPFQHVRPALPLKTQRYYRSIPTGTTGSTTVRATALRFWPRYKTRNLPVPLPVPISGTTAPTKKSPDLNFCPLLTHLFPQILTTFRSPFDSKF
jgi:hypothetical protein